MLVLVQAVWRSYYKNPSSLFLRTLGSRVRADYEACDCPDTLPTRGNRSEGDVIETMALLQALETRMRQAGALVPGQGAPLLAHKDAKDGCGSPFSQLVWRWVDNHGSQLMRSVRTFVEHEHAVQWEPMPGCRTSFSVTGVFTMFQESVDTFFCFGVASEDIFLTLVEHIVHVCVHYANAVVGSCFEPHSLEPHVPPPSLPRRLRPEESLPPRPHASTPPSTQSVVVRINNMHEGLQQFTLFFAAVKERWRVAPLSVCCERCPRTRRLRGTEPRGRAHSSPTPGPRARVQYRKQSESLSSGGAGAGTRYTFANVEHAQGLSIRRLDYLTARLTPEARLSLHDSTAIK